MVVVYYRDHLADSGVGHVGYVDQKLVHADPADNVGNTTADLHLRPVGQTAEVPVGIAQRHDRQPCLATGGKRPSVAYRVPGADSF